jgi:C-terminal processing protease CtpA/Prc
MADTNSAAAQGRELYHAIWELVGATFFDTSRLTDWASWEHRFDEQIADEATALRFADEMLASLNDTYTERVVPPTLAPVPSTSDADAPAQADEKPADVMAVLTPDKLGYLRISSFDREDVVDLIEAAIAKLEGCEGIMLDLRQNNGGRMHQALDASGFFLVDGLLATLKFRHEGGIKLREYFLNGTQFFARETLPDGTKTTDMYTRRKPLLALKPIVLIINRRTASAGEMMVATLVQNGFPGMVTIVGSGVTPGKGIGQAEFEVLDGKAKVRVTRCRWYAPGGEWLGDCGQTESNGIEPDTMVPDDRGPEALAVAAKELRKMLGRPEKAA